MNEIDTKIDLFKLVVQVILTKGLFNQLKQKKEQN